MEAKDRNKKFFELISDYIIEIPIIQREYAQGRTTPKINTIRKRFVESLVKVVKGDKDDKDDKDGMFLGFVYGKVEGREQEERRRTDREAVDTIMAAVKHFAISREIEIESKIIDQSKSENETQLKFIPLDGQQRLTTLYLLFWYLHLKDSSVEEKQWLKNFKYTNRKNTADFFEAIINDVNIENLRNSEVHNIRESIQNAPFYLKKWDRDPSVSGMLEMLAEIDRNFDKDFNFSEIKLEELNFHFDFMDLDELRQTDELYIKMNARGKQLSDYDHFKSWLQQYYQNSEDTDWLEGIWKKMNTVWLDYFWQNTDAPFSGLEDMLYRFGC